MGVGKHAFSLAILISLFTGGNGQLVEELVTTTRASVGDLTTLDGFATSTATPVSDASGNNSSLAASVENTTSHTPDSEIELGETQIPSNPFNESAFAASPIETTSLSNPTSISSEHQEDQDPFQTTPFPTEHTESRSSTPLPINSSQQPDSSLILVMKEDGKISMEEHTHEPKLVAANESAISMTSIPTTTTLATMTVAPLLANGSTLESVLLMTPTTNELHISTANISHQSKFAGDDWMTTAEPASNVQDLNPILFNDTHELQSSTIEAVPTQPNTEHIPSTTMGVSSKESTHNFEETFPTTTTITELETSSMPETPISGSTRQPDHGHDHPSTMESTSSTAEEESVIAGIDGKKSVFSDELNSTVVLPVIESTPNMETNPHQPKEVTPITKTHHPLSDLDPETRATPTPTTHHSLSDLDPNTSSVSTTHSSQSTEPTSTVHLEHEHHAHGAETESTLDIWPHQEVHSTMTPLIEASHPAVAAELPISTNPASNNTSTAPSTITESIIPLGETPSTASEGSKAMAPLESTTTEEIFTTASPLPPPNGEDRKEAISNHTPFPMPPGEENTSPIEPQPTGLSPTTLPPSQEEDHSPRHPDPTAQPNERNGASSGEFKMPFSLRFPNIDWSPQFEDHESGMFRKLKEQVSSELDEILRKAVGDDNFLRFNVVSARKGSLIVEGEIVSREDLTLDASYIASKLEENIAASGSRLGGNLVDTTSIKVNGVLSRGAADRPQHSMAEGATNTGYVIAGAVGIGLLIVIFAIFAVVVFGINSRSAARTLKVREESFGMAERGQLSRRYDAENSDGVNLTRYGSQSRGNNSPKRLASQNGDSSIEATSSSSPYISPMVLNGSQFTPPSIYRDKK